jgi:hypothetical protein
MVALKGSGAGGCDWQQRGGYPRPVGSFLHRSHRGGLARGIALVDLRKYDATASRCATRNSATSVLRTCLIPTPSITPPTALPQPRIIKLLKGSFSLPALIWGERWLAITPTGC